MMSAAVVSEAVSLSLSASRVQEQQERGPARREYVEGNAVPLDMSVVNGRAGDDMPSLRDMYLDYLDGKDDFRGLVHELSSNIVAMGLETAALGHVQVACEGFPPRILSLGHVVSVGRHPNCECVSRPPNLPFSLPPSLSQWHTHATLIRRCWWGDALAHSVVCGVVSCLFTAWYLWT
jgi:hypothetical protein